MIFKEKLGYVPELFSYPFGEYSEFMRNYISKNFTFAFGQHSGVIDLNKEKFQLKYRGHRPLKTKHYFV